MLANPDCAAGSQNCNCAARVRAMKPGDPISVETLAVINRKRAEREELKAQAKTLGDAIGSLRKLQSDAIRRCETLSDEITRLAEPERDGLNLVPR